MPVVEKQVASPFARGLAEPGGPRRIVQELDDRIAERPNIRVFRPRSAWLAAFLFCSYPSHLKPHVKRIVIGNALEYGCETGVLAHQRRPGPRLLQAVEAQGE